jgi:hypothetical protein
VGFDLTTHCSSLLDTTRPRHHRKSISFGFCICTLHLCV